MSQTFFITHSKLSKTGSSLQSAITIIGIANMAQPQTVEDIFEGIFQAAKDTHFAYRPTKYGRFVDGEIERLRRTHVFMGDLTGADYFSWRMRALNQQKQLELAQPAPNAGQFWNAAYAFSPHSTPADTITELEKILRSRRLGSVHLGRLPEMNDGQLKLIPGLTALPPTKEEDRIHLHYAATDSGAISYADGRPAGLDEQRQQWVKSSEDTKLRRFASLGWVILVRPNGSWSKTGHALVMDMDEGRDRHPWYVLASHWPSEFEDADGNFTTYAEKKVLRGDFMQPGVLPGGRDRIAIAKLWANDQGSSPIPMLRRFGPDFEYEVLGTGGTRSESEESEIHGPDLAHVMHWYWDPAAEVEVCFGEDDKEYMRYNLQTKQYTCP